MELDSLSLWPIYAIIGSVLAVACPLGLALAIVPHNLGNSYLRLSLLKGLRRLFILYCSLRCRTELRSIYRVKYSYVDLCTVSLSDMRQGTTHLLAVG